MHKSTKMWLGLAALGVVAVGGIAYAASKKPVAITGPQPAGTLLPATSLGKGHNYILAATVPAGVTDATTLSNALVTNGWSNVTVQYFMGSGTIPQGLEANATSYIASGTWNGADGTPVPTGVVAVQTS